MLSDVGMISEEQIISSFGARLKCARLKKGMTQEELGSALGIDKSRVSDYENGNRRCSITTAYRLAKSVGVSFDYLLDGKEEEDMKSYQKGSKKEKLVHVLTSIGFAIVDWQFVSFSDESFADYSTMHALGLTEDSLGEVLNRFEGIKRAAGKKGSSGYEKSIISAAEEYAEKLLSSETFQSSIANI